MSFIIVHKIYQLTKGVQVSKTFPNQIKVYKLRKLNNLEMCVVD